MVLYRSDSLSFTADGGSQVESRSVGSDTWVEMINSVPDCNKNYYFVVRAFDSTGNGSGIIGDEVTVTTSSTTTSSTGTTLVTVTPTNIQAIQVNQSDIESSEVNPTQEPNSEITVEQDGTSGILGGQTTDPFWKTNPFRISVIVVLAGLYIILRKKVR